MDESTHFQSILTSLRKPQSSKRILQVLTALRKEINGPTCRTKIEMVQRQNGLKYLISYTQYDSNLKVIDLALSILGNCCMVTIVIQEMINDLNVLNHLNRVLEKHDKDSIKGRVFRILGNLCDGYDVRKLMEKEAKIIANLFDFLKKYDDDTSVATLSMALRFVRKLIVIDTFDVLAQNYNMIRIIGMVFIKCANNWLVKSEDDVLLNDVLKIIQILACSCYSHRDIIEELKTTESGNALQSFGDIILYNPERIVKLILKLARLSRHKSDLPIERIITKLLESIKADDEESNKRKHHEYLECINRLMDHQGFHDKLKSTNSIDVLINLLKAFDVDRDVHVHCCIHICAILNKSKFNECLIKTQLNSDIIYIIMEKLRLITGKSLDVIQIKGHDKNKTPSYRNIKRQKPNDIQVDERDSGTSLNGYNNKKYQHVQIFPETIEEISYEMDNDINKTNERCASPSSCSDISSCGPFSPPPTTNLIGEESDSDNYSPLCSESEGDDEFKESIPDDDVILSETEEKRPNYSQSQIDLRYKFRDEMIALLKYYTTIKPMCSQLGDSKLIILLMNILFDSINGSNCDKRDHLAFSVVNSIVQTRDFLIPFMISGVIPQIYEVKDTKHGDCCTDCEQVRKRADNILANFTSMGQNESVKGDIAYLLLGKTKDDIKCKLALSIPYVIRNNTVLNKLMIDYGALRILTNLLKDETNITMQNKSIKSLCTLATDSLRINNPVNKKLMRKKLANNTRIKIGDYALSSTCKNVVTFKLDDGKCVKADRDSLNEKSDYFRTMLSGHFVESAQNEIVLKNVAFDSLNCLLQLLNLNLKNGCALQFDFYNFTTILDVILLTDRFLLHDLNYSLVCHVEQLLSTTTVPILYKWAIESCTNIMRIESVAYALVSDISYKDRLTMFHNLFKLGYCLELVEDVEKLIIQFF